MSRSRPAAVSSSRAIASARRSDVEPLAGDLADDPDAEAGAGERVAPDHRRRQAELLADRADLVLEQGAQRLDELELQVVGQPADVVVGLDGGGAGAAAGLDDVGVERALDEVRRRLGARVEVAEDPDLGGLEGADELAADDLALLLGVADPVEGVEELVGGVDDVEVAEHRLEVAAYLLGLAVPHHPVVDVDAGEPVADGALHDRGGDGGVDAAGQRADRAPLADLVADPLDLLVDDVEHRPGRPAAGDLEQEVLEHLLAVLGVQHLGVPLDAGHPARRRPRRRRPG